jgi:hypothetical protein
MKPPSPSIPLPSVGSRLLQSLPVLVSAFGLFGGLFGIFAYFVGLSSTAPVGWIAVTATILLSVCVMLCDFVRHIGAELRAALAQQVELPKILRSLPHMISPGGGLLLLVEPSHLLGQGHAVSVYIMQDGFELLLGEGHVQVVQQDSHVQVVMTRPASGMDNVLRELAENKPSSLDRTLVRPGQQIEGRI